LNFEGTASAQSMRCQEQKPAKRVKGYGPAMPDGDPAGMDWTKLERGFGTSINSEARIRGFLGSTEQVLRQFLPRFWRLRRFLFLAE
jgi:hypothetical protein